MSEADEKAPAMMRLGEARPGFTGIVEQLDASGVASSLSAGELEARLLEFGFLEGAHISVLHQGIVGGDPIAIRVENATIALRRREAMAIVVSRTSAD